MKLTGQTKAIQNHLSTVSLVVFQWQHIDVERWLTVPQAECHKIIGARCAGVLTSFPMSQTAALLDAHAGAAFIVSCMPFIDWWNTFSFIQHSRSHQLCPGPTSLPEPSGPCRHSSSALESNVFATAIPIHFGSELRKPLYESHSLITCCAALMDPSLIS